MKRSPVTVLWWGILAILVTTVVLYVNVPFMDRTFALILVGATALWVWIPAILFQLWVWEKEDGR
jgi:hypothetical protein